MAQVNNYTRVNRVHNCQVRPAPDPNDPAPVDHLADTDPNMYVMQVDESSKRLMDLSLNNTARIFIEIPVSSVG